MLSYTIFLASSNELADDRERFGHIVADLNNLMQHEQKHVQFLLYKHEYGLYALSDRRKQEVYNDQIRRCAIFVMLYGSKVGAFTEEEFDLAYQLFKSTKVVPQVLVYKKSGLAAASCSAAFLIAVSKRLAKRARKRLSSRVAKGETRNLPFTDGTSGFISASSSFMAAERASCFFWRLVFPLARGGGWCGSMRAAN